MKTSFLAAALLATVVSGQAFAEGCTYAKPAETAQISNPDTAPMVSKSTGDASATTIAAAPATAPEAVAVKPATIAAASVAPTVKPN